jgi:hypothetical protein
MGGWKDIEYGRKEGYRVLKEGRISVWKDGRVPSMEGWKDIAYRRMT